MRKTLLYLTALFLVVGCASKRFTKKAMKFEEAGLFEDAAHYYYEAVIRKDSNVEAKLGLRKNGQLVLDKKLEAFHSLYKQADYQQAVYKFIDADNYYKKVTGVKVELEFPEHFREYYNESKNSFLSQKYIEGDEKLNREDFTGALQVFSEIKKIDPGFKDVKEKFIIAKYEPMYRKANDYLENDLPRKAYYTFDEILRGTGGYKQSLELKNEAQEKATITILMDRTAFRRYGFKNIADKVNNSVKAELTHMNNPFIKLVEATSYETPIYLNNGEINMKAANLAGIDAVLSNMVTKAYTSNGNLHKSSQKGYTKEIYKVKNKEGEEITKVRYHKVYYTEYKQANSVVMGVSFKLVNTANASIMVSDQFERSNADKVHFATFKGDKKKLVPGYWKYKNRESSQDVIKDNSSDVRRLQRLLKANREIKDTYTLMKEVQGESVRAIAESVNNYNPER